MWMEIYNFMLQVVLSVNVQFEKNIWKPPKDSSGLTVLLGRFYIACWLWEALLQRLIKAMTVEKCTVCYYRLKNTSSIINDRAALKFLRRGNCTTLGEADRWSINWAKDTREIHDAAAAFPISCH